MTIRSDKPQWTERWIAGRRHRYSDDLAAALQAEAVHAALADLAEKVERMVDTTSFDYRGEPAQWVPHWNSALRSVLGLIVDAHVGPWPEVPVPMDPAIKRRLAEQADDWGRVVDPVDGGRTER